MGNIIENLEALYRDCKDPEIEELIIDAWAERIRKNFYVWSEIPDFIKEETRIQKAVVESIIHELIKNHKFWDEIPEEYKNNVDIIRGYKIICRREVNNYLNNENDIFGDKERIEKLEEEYEPFVT